MRYSIGPRERRYVKAYGFLSFAKKMGTHATKVAKNLNNKYDQKLVDIAKKSATRSLRIVDKKAVLNTAEASGDLVGNFIADKITSISKKKQQMNHTQMQLAMKYQKNIYISPQERQKIIDELKLI